MDGHIETIHVTLGHARAGDVRNALRLLGREERVIGLSKDLTFGPISLLDPDSRQEWIGTVLRYEPGEEPDEAEEPWAEATSMNVYPAIGFA